MPSAAPPSRPEILADRACFAAACLLPVAWFCVFNASLPSFLVDEAGHLGNVYHFFEGKPGWPEQMTMLPGYHFIVAALWQLHPPCSLLTLARLVPTVCAVLGTVSFAFTWRRLHPRAAASLGGAGRIALLFALLPILQPFSALAYTDYPALAVTLVAFGAQVAGHRLVAALLFAGAIFLRQTNLLWVAFAVAWEFTRRDAPREKSLRRTGALLLLLLAAVAVVLATGRLTVGAQTGTALSFNPATVHFGAALAVLLCLPPLVARAPAAARRLLAACRSRPVLTGLFAALALGGAWLATHTFANPHIWNRELFWSGSPFTLLRNWPLVWIDGHPSLRFLSGALVVLVTIAAVVFLAGQPQRRALVIALTAGLALPFANNLVEPRYFIPGAAFLLLFCELERTTMWQLAVWWSALVVLHAPFVARGLSLW